uniref:Uncharacterized protein n=1 Tax=Rhizophora mucronata TaxID=61149 RepID=A0A2P2P3E5_RHIMU
MFSFCEFTTHDDFQIYSHFLNIP